MITKQASYKTTPFSTIGQWIAMAITIFILAILADVYLHDWMASFGLGWVIPVVSGVSGALGVTRVVTTMVNVNIALSLDALLGETRTLLKYNTIINAINKLKEKTS